MSCRYKVIVLCGVLLAGCLEKEKSQNSCDDPRSCIAMARARVDADQPKEAIKLLEDFIHKNGDNADVSEILAEACFANDDPELSAFYFEQAAGLSDLKYYNYIRAAEIYRKIEDRDRAQVCYENYLKIFPEDNEAQVAYAMMLKQAGHLREALMVLTQHAGEDVDVFTQIAGIFGGFKNYVQERNWYLKALQLDRKNLSSLEGLWNFYLRFRDWSNLKKIAERLLEAGIPQLHDVDIAAVIKSIDQLKFSIKGLSEINLSTQLCSKILENVSLQEKNMPSQAARWALSDSPQSTQESELIEGVIDSKEMKEKRLWDSVNFAKDRKDWESASKVLWKILGLNRQNGQAWEVLADCLQKSDKYDIAEMAMLEALKYQNYREDLYLAYLDIAIRVHNNSDYVNILHEAKRKLPKSAGIRLAWARAQEIYKEDLDGAINSYKKFLKMVPPESQEAEKVRTILNLYKE